MDDVIINCDWLQYSVMLESEFPELICPDGFRLEILQGNNIFRNRCLVFDSYGEKWLTLLWSPFSSVLNSRVMTVQVANWLLYRSGIMESFRLLQSIVECHFNSCGRVDICCDFQMDDERLGVLKHLNSGHYYVQGKSEGSAWWHQVCERSGERDWKRPQFHCLSWGSKNTDIKVKCYHKSREINALCENGDCSKPYIKALWDVAGWDIGNIWRLEFSLCGSGRLRWKGEGIDLPRVSSSSWLRHVFYSLYGSRFVVRENTGARKGHKNLDPVRSFLHLPPEDEVLVRSLGMMNGKECPESIKVLRRLVGQLSSPSVVSSSAVCEALVSAICVVVESHGLQGYFLSHFGDEYHRYLQRVLDESGSGIFEVDGTPARSWS